MGLQNWDDTTWQASLFPVQTLYKGLELSNPDKVLSCRIQIRKFLRFLGTSSVGLGGDGGRAELRGSCTQMPLRPVGRTEFSLPSREFTVTKRDTGMSSLGDA